MLNSRIYFIEKILRQVVGVLVFFLAANFLSPTNFANYNLILVTIAIFSPLLFFVQEPILIRFANQQRKITTFLIFQSFFTLIFILAMIACEQGLTVFLIFLMPMALLRIYDLKRYQNFYKNLPDQNGIIDLMSNMITFPIKLISLKLDSINLLATCILLDYFLPSLLFAIQRELHFRQDKFFNSFKKKYLPITPKVISVLCLPAFFAGILQGIGTRLVFHFAEETMSTLYLAAFFILIRMIDFSASVVNICAPIIQVQFQLLSKTEGQLRLRTLLLIAIVFLASSILSYVLFKTAYLIFPLYYKILVEYLVFLPPVVTLMTANLFTNILHYERSQTITILCKSMILVVVMAILISFPFDLNISSILLAFILSYTLQLILSVWRLNVLSL